MKKFLSVLLIAVLVFTVGAIAFADGEGSAPEWFRDKMSWQRDRIDESVKNGDMTENQAEQFKENLDERERYVNENGFNDNCPNGQRRKFRRRNEDNEHKGSRSGNRFNGNCPYNQEAN